MTGRAALLALATVAALGQAATSPLVAPALIGENAAPDSLIPKLLLWNASASVPRGLYLLRSPQPLHIGELVSVMAPDALARFAATRGYLPLGVPLLKHIAALPGQTICRHTRTITIDGQAVAEARKRDTRGRLLPSWQGCRLLRAGQVFLLNPAVADSFDGRYFGVLSASAITARAEPLWTISEPR